MQQYQQYQQYLAAWQGYQHQHQQQLQQQQYYQHYQHYQPYGQTTYQQPMVCFTNSNECVLPSNNVQKKSSHNSRQVLTTNLQGNVSQLEGRINNQILGVKGLTSVCKFSILFCMFKHQKLLEFPNIYFILMTLMFESGVILFGEIRCLSLQLDAYHTWLKG